MGRGMKTAHVLLQDFFEPQNGQRDRLQLKMNCHKRTQRSQRKQCVPPRSSQGCTLATRLNESGVHRTPATLGLPGQRDKARCPGQEDFLVTVAPGQAAEKPGVGLTIEHLLALMEASAWAAKVRRVALFRAWKEHGFWHRGIAGLLIVTSFFQIGVLLSGGYSGRPHYALGATPALLLRIVQAQFVSTAPGRE